MIANDWGGKLTSLFGYWVMRGPRLLLLAEAATQFIRTFVVWCDIDVNRSQRWWNESINQMMSGRWEGLMVKECGTAETIRSIHGWLWWSCAAMTKTQAWRHYSYYADLGRGTIISIVPVPVLLHQEGQLLLVTRLLHTQWLHLFFHPIDYSGVSKGKILKPRPSKPASLFWSLWSFCTNWASFWPLGCSKPLALVEKKILLLYLPTESKFLTCHNDDAIGRAPRYTIALVTVIESYLP